MNDFGKYLIKSFVVILFSTNVYSQSINVTKVLKNVSKIEFTDPYVISVNLQVSNISRHINLLMEKKELDCLEDVDNIEKLLNSNKNIYLYINPLEFFLVFRYINSMDSIFLQKEKWIQHAGFLLYSCIEVLELLKDQTITERLNNQITDVYKVNVKTFVIGKLSTNAYNRILVENSTARRYRLARRKKYVTFGASYFEGPYDIPWENCP